tara:strand:- start:1768 stop:2001 length:234 start_codon:yes stop_codon:yes gene_type:complete
MKSPIIKVGIIEPEGILYGSTINDLIRSTKNNIGKMDDENSFIFIIRGFLCFIRLKIPVKKVTTIKIRVKSIMLLCS